jgi:hypothetical protein
MRLTLRTLLAYLDDILPAAQARDIGAKIAESSMAQDLVGRLREVTRRRRLMAPDVDGPGMGVDPNVVAEYLDNELPPEDVADVERVCLESDIHLAEVAAAHQILTLVLGDPAPVTPRSLDRMYALGPVGRRPVNGFASAERVSGKESVYADPARMPGAATAAAATGVAAATAPSVVSAESRVPEYLRSKSVFQKAIPWLVVLGMAALFVGLLSTDPAFRSKFHGTDSVNPATGGQDVAAASTAPAKDSSAELSKTDVATAPATDPATVPANAAATTSPAKPVVASIDPAPPEEPGDARPAPMPPASKPATEVAVVTPVAPNKPGSKANPVEPPPGGDTEKPVPAKPPVPNPPVANPPVAKPAPRGPRIEYTSPDGVLLAYDPAVTDWRAIPHRSVINVGDRIASPEPFDSVLLVEKGLLTATVVNGTVLDLIEPTATAPLGFALRHGRLLLQTKTIGEGENAGQPQVVAVSLKAGADVWRLELGDDTLCAIEIIAHEPTRLEQNMGTTGWHGRIAVVTGSASLLDAAGTKRALPARSALDLLPTIGSVDPVAPPPAEAAASSPTVTEGADMPRWIELGNSRQIEKRVLSLYEKEFDPALAVSAFLPALIDNPLPMLSELAAKGLAITDNYGALVKAMASAPHKETRIAAINGLRMWLAQTPKNGALLIGELERNFPTGDDTIIYTLLWGFSDEDARDPTKCSLLVDLLEHAQLGVRELAYYHLKNTTRLGYRYDAQMPPAQRKLATGRFRSHLLKEGGTFAKDKEAKESKETK